MPACNFSSDKNKATTEESKEIEGKQMGKTIEFSPIWKIKDESIGSIDKNGVFIPKKVGETIVYANVGNIIKTYKITVTDKDIKSGQKGRN